MRAVVRCVGVLLGIAVLLGLPVRSEAGMDVYTCTDAGNVWVVVTYQGAVTQGCAVAPSSGIDALRQVTSYEVANGMISRIGGKPATLDPNPYVYWNYFHRDRAGDGWGGWVYSSLGAGSYKPKPGSIEGWTYGKTGTQVAWTPPTRPVATTAAPAPARTSPTVQAPQTSIRPANTSAAAPRTTSAVPAVTASPSVTSSALSAPAVTGSAEPVPTPTAEASQVVASAPATTVTPSVVVTAPAPDRGSPTATIVTLAGVAAAAGIGAGVVTWRRRQSPP